MPPLRAISHDCALPSLAGTNPSLSSRRAAPHLSASDGTRPRCFGRLPRKLPAPVSRARVGGAAKPGALTLSAAPLVSQGDPSRRAPAPGAPGQALRSAPGRGGPKHCLRESPSPDRTGPAGKRLGKQSASGTRLDLSSRAAPTPSRRDHRPKPLVTHHLASAARTAAAGSASAKAALRSGSCLGTLRKPIRTKSLAAGVALWGLVSVGRYNL